MTRIETAVYGDSGGAHRLRVASLRGPLPSELAGLVDRPSHYPHESLSLLACAPVPPYFAVWASFDDPNASRRGMVRSYVALAPLADVGKLDDLSLVTTCLPSVLGNDELSPLDIDVTSHRPLGAGPQRLESLCNLLVDPDRSRPVVIPDFGDWPTLLHAIWQRLWPEARRALSARHSIGPESVPSSTILVTPRPSTSKWRGYPVVHEGEVEGSAAGSALLQGSVSVQINGLDRLPSDPRLVGALIRSSELFEMLRADTACVRELKPMIELVARACPSESESVDLKQQLSSKLASQLARATRDDIFSVSNLQIPAGWPAASAIRDSVEEWASHAVKTMPAADAASVMSRVPDERFQAWWRESVLRGLQKEFRENEREMIAAVWNWCVVRTETLQELSDVALLTAERDAALAAASPNPLSKALAGAARAVAEARGWPHLLAVSNVALVSVDEAIQRQNDFRIRSREAIDTLISRVRPEEVVACAANGHTEVTAKAVESISRDASLLERADVRQVGWRSLWLKAVKAGAQAWPVNARALADTVIAALLDGIPLEDAFLEGVAPGFPSLLDHPRRAEIGPLLPVGVKSPMLRATVAEWLRRVRDGDSVPTIEDDLASDAEKVTCERIAAAPDNDEELLRVIRALPKEGIVETWIFNPRKKPLKPGVGAAIGALIQKYEWRNASRDALAASRRGESDLRPLLVECRDLFSRTDRWSIPTGHAMSWEDRHALFREFHKIVCDLSPQGPSLSLWEDAGGEASTHPHLITGSDSWKHALDQVERGSYRAPRAERLVELLLKEFGAGPHGEKLRLFMRLLKQ